MKTKWTLDRNHSEVFLKAKYLMITEITGRLDSFDLELQTEGPGFSQITDIVFSAEVASINMNNAKRDKHLMSADFFDVQSYPTISFQGNKFEPMCMEKPITTLSVFRMDYNLSGNLTIKGITKEIELNGYFKGTAINAVGEKVAGFNFSSKISRKDFNMNWQTANDAGTLILGDEIMVCGNIQLVKQSW